MAIDREKLIDRIRTIEGLTDDERSALMGLLRERKTYGLVWEDKPEAVEEKLRSELPILREVKDRAIICDNADAPNHILIEGDNLEVLTALAYTHEGKIDVIYIDPPYNTGNKDFVYNDSFVDREDGYRHSKWLSFMAKRLRIAKRLLSDRGVIFISIDDNEQAQLKLLCDEVFGEQNQVANFCWKARGGRQDSKYFAVMHEYILCYAKAIQYFKAGEDLKEVGDYPKFDETKQRYYKTQLLRKWGSNSLRSDRPNLYYPIPGPNGEDIYPLIYSTSGENSALKSPILGCWRWSASTMANARAEGRIEFIKDKAGNWIPYEKIFAPLEGELPKKKFTTWIEDGNNGAKELKEIFEVSPFDYPKSIRILTLIMKMANLGDDSIILDFFAGSGTTLHATMQLNAEDGGNRQCILVTNNENGICENVTYKRNKRVIQGYTTPKGEHVEGLTENNLRYYRTDFIGRSRSMRNMHQLVNLATDMLCIKENLYTEQKKMAGMKTHPQIFRFFDDGRKQMLIIYREEYISEIVDLIDTMEVKQPMKVYVFSPSDDPATELFEDVADKVELTALPAAIYNTYKRILPKRRNQWIEGEEDALTSAEDETESLGGLFAKGGDQ